MLQLKRPACQEGRRAVAPAAVDRQVHLAAVHLQEREEAALPEEHRAVPSPEELPGLRQGEAALEVASVVLQDRRVTPAFPP